MAYPLPQVVGDLLRARGLKLATAESCTGGLVGHLITNVPGSSDYFLGGVVAYAYEAKTALLGVPTHVLLTYGAVSEETALAMARGVREKLGADIAISITGILGPGGGTPTKKVGLVFVSLVCGNTEFVRQYVWDGDRLENKSRSAEAAFSLLEEYLEGSKG